MNDRIPFESFVVWFRRAAISLYVAAAVLLLVEPLRPFSGVALFAAMLLHKLAGPLLPHAGLPLIGEGGIRDPRSSTWIRFEEIGEVRRRDLARYDAELIELLDTSGKLVAQWSQPADRADEFARLESFIGQARSTPDPMSFGRGSSNVADWLAGLRRRFLHRQDYRCLAVDLDVAALALRDVANPADVRAGAAVALIASRQQRRLEQVRAAVNHSSPPLLLAICGALDPALVDEESVRDARPYLTDEERCATDSFASRTVLSQAQIRLGPDRGGSASRPAELEADALSARAPCSTLRS